MSALRLPDHRLAQVRTDQTHRAALYQQIEEKNFEVRLPATEKKDLEISSPNKSRFVRTLIKMEHPSNDNRCRVKPIELMEQANSVVQSSWTAWKNSGNL